MSAPTWTIKQGDWIERLRELPDESVHCCVTSPPYWRLRDYGAPGQLGLEKTPEEYIAKCVAGFREVRRVLRSDGTLWLNMGDCYTGNRGNTQEKPGLDNKYLSANLAIGHKKLRTGKDCDPKRGPAAPGQPLKHSRNGNGLKGKDLVGLPWMLAFALRADGWYLRAQCPWIKRNSMPESVIDRPGTSTEIIFLLSKSKTYFYDAEAVKMPVAGTAHMRSAAASEYPSALLREGEARRRPGVNPKALHNNTRKERAREDHSRGPTELMNGIRPERDGINRGDDPRGRKLKCKMPGVNSRIYQDRDPQHSSARKSRQNESFSAAVASLVLTRGRRNHDWFMDSWQGLLSDECGDPLAFVVNPSPFPEAHFATFPPKLVEPCILAGTSEKGCCPKCGAQWERVVESSGLTGEGKLQTGARPAADERGVSDSSILRTNGRTFKESHTTGWRRVCHCYSKAVNGLCAHSNPNLMMILRSDHEPIPCAVLDPFSGAGTTGLIALRYHRSFIGIELKPEYAEMARKRIEQDAPLFNTLTDTQKRLL